MKSKSCIATGVFLTAVDSVDPSKRFVLLGVNKHGHLCHQHGFNDDRSGPTCDTLGYVDAAVNTASREFAEESLEAAGSMAAMRAALSDDRFSRQVFPCTNTPAFWVFLGSLGPASRRAIVERFQLMLQRQGLSRCQREIAELVWVPANSIAERVASFAREKKAATSQDVIADVPVDDGRHMPFRSWLTGHLMSVFAPDVADGRSEAAGLVEFRNWCAGSAACPLRPFTDL